jgi:hypothetical protein
MNHRGTEAQRSFCSETETNMENRPLESSAGTMDDLTFASHLSAWLDPYELLNAAERYDRDRDRALAAEGLLLSSSRLTRGDEANFATMVEVIYEGSASRNP